MSICCAAVSAAAGTDGAQGQPLGAGLLWNRTGLPAVFPLQVKTKAGQDYFLKLIDDETRQDALAAYITGGAFFKVLVPPGTYVLRFATGKFWEGEEGLIGPAGNPLTFDLPVPLTFGIRDFGTKAGHVVDIRQTGPGQFAQATVRHQFICQTTRTRFWPPRSSFLRSMQIDRREFEGVIRKEPWGWGPFDWPAFGEMPYPNRGYKYFSYPRSVVRARIC
ncbi:MAG: hypothetical protein ABJI96_10245 [Paracoccaceae bacterium]